MNEQNRRYVQKEIGRLLSEIWRIKGLAEQEYGPQHPIAKKLSSMHGEAQELLREKIRKAIIDIYRGRCGFGAGQPKT